MLSLLREENREDWRCLGGVVVGTRRMKGKIVVAVVGIGLGDCLTNTTDREMPIRAAVILLLRFL